MKLKHTILFGFSLALVFGFSQTPAMAGFSRIFGASGSGGNGNSTALHQLPLSVCSVEGQVLRLQADVVDYYGNRAYFPANQFIWRFTRSNGFWDQWDAGSFQRGYSFSHGREPNSVYLTIPSRVGSEGKLQVLARGHSVYTIQVMDFGAARPSTCVWADADVYVDARGIPDIPPPSRHEDPVVCGTDCQVNAKCLDGCPGGAECNFVPGDLDNEAYWEILSCGSPHGPAPRKCYGECIVGDYCSDSCPFEAICEFHPTGPVSPDPSWEVLACPIR